MRPTAARVLSGCLLMLAGYGCASPQSGGGGSGTGNSTGNATNGTGGSHASTSGAGGTTTGAGGSHTSTTGSGGSHTSTTGAGGGGTSTGPACTPNPTQLVNANAYNCDSSAIGIQGSIYPYGDGMSCPYSPTTPPTTNFCAGDKCCLSGTTSVPNATGSNWGCGIGVELDDDGTTKNVYAGTVSCFTITLTGSSGGNVVRIGFTQSATPPANTVAPYTELPAFTNGWTGNVCFSDVTCPAWSAPTPTATMPGCTKTGTNGTPVDMQIQISAGQTAGTVGAYNVCLTSIVPMGTSGAGGSGGGSTSSCANPSGSGTITGKFDAFHVSCPKDYMVQNNDWGVSSPSQTLSYGPGTKFKVLTQGGVGSNGAPASYPSIFTGIAPVGTTAASGLPLAVSSISPTGISTSWTYSNSGVSGSYNAAYDVWFSTSSGGDGTGFSVPSGGYLMVWFYIPTNNQPVGALVPNGSVTINGKPFNIWYGTNNGRSVVSYVPTSTSNSFSSWTYPLGAFIQDAAGRTCATSGGTTTKCIQSTWYLETVYAGFEIWNGGGGLQTTDFGVTVP